MGRNIDASPPLWALIKGPREATEWSAMEEADVAATAMRAAEKQAAKEARERAAMQKCEAEVWAVAAMIARELTAMEIADDEAVRAEEWTVLPASCAIGLTIVCTVPTVHGFKIGQWMWHGGVAVDQSAARDLWCDCRVV